MSVELLTYANRQRVAEALTERGYSVTRMTVNRWARGSEMPEIAARMILELFGHSPGATKEAAMPGWAQRLEQRLVEELQRNRDVIEALARPEIWQAAERVIERLEALPPPGDGAPSETDEGEDQAATEPPNRGRGPRHGPDDG